MLYFNKKCSMQVQSCIVNLLLDSAFDPFSHLSFLNVSFGWSHFQLDFNPISKWKLYSTDVPACSVQQPIVWSPRSEQINLDCVCRFLESKLSFFLHVKFSKCMSMHTLPLSTRICLYFLWFYCWQMVVFIFNNYTLPILKFTICRNRYLFSSYQ